MKSTAIQKLHRELIRYCVTCLFLAGINYITSPGYWWVLWVVAGWGFSLVLPLLYQLAGCAEEND